MIKFIKEPSENFLLKQDYTTITYEIDNNEMTWPELLIEFRYFLHACGYHFKDEEADE